MQDSQQRSRSFLLMLIIWMGSFFLLQRFMPKPPPPKEVVLQKLEEARKLEKEGRQGGSGVAKADRVKKLEQAASRYEEYYHLARSVPELKGEALVHRFQAINVYDYLAGLEGEKAGTHWYDQAETRLKEIEKDGNGKTGAVTLEVDGRQVKRSGDFGKIASARLNTIRAARDEVNRSNWAYQSLDVLVRLTGRQPAYSYFLALLLVVVVLKVVTYPFQKRQYQYMKDMARVAPLIREAQEKMKGRPPEEVNRRVLQIYKENNFNMAGGCLPMLVTGFALIPVFWMVRAYEFQFTHATFLWIGSEVSARLWWVADNLAQFDVPLFLLYMASLIISMLIQPRPADRQQAQQQKLMLWMMPAIFGWFMWVGQWSSAFMLYWLVLNLVSMYQTWLLNRQLGAITPAAAAAGAAPATSAPAAPLAPMGIPGANGRGGNVAAPRGGGGRARARRSGRR